MSLIGNVIVISDSTVTQNEADGYILSDNLIKVAISVTSDNGSDESNLPALYDGMTTIAFTAPAGLTTVEVTLPEAVEIDSSAVAGATFKTSQASVDFYTWNISTLTYELKSSVNGLQNNTPVLRGFNATTTNKVKFVFDAVSDLRIGELAVGKSIRLPVNPELGFNVAQDNNLDTISGGVTESNAQANRTRSFRGSSQTSEYNNLELDFVNNTWRPFIRDNTGKPVWFGWNQTERPDEVIYGVINQEEPSFSSGYRKDIAFTITGNA